MRSLFDNKIATSVDMLRRARRPEPHFLTLPEIEALINACHRIAHASKRDRANALRVELAIFTGLRPSEIHNLRRDDLRSDGTIAVRMGPHLKRQKPRIAAFVNGLAASPTLAAITESPWPQWPSEYYAWQHWVVHRLGPYSGLQREIGCTNGNQTIRRYLIHPHVFRAAWVCWCRRWPRANGRPPISWETIAQLAGWDNPTTHTFYYWADLDETLEEIRNALGTTSTAT
jgi:integrase